MASYKLTYFNGAGRGELIRLIFAAANQKYEDKRIEFSDWPALKESGTLPFNTLPLLEVKLKDSTELRMNQSQAIARYLAKKFNLAGKNVEETAECGMYMDQLNDLLVDYFGILYSELDEAAKKEKLGKFSAETLPTTLKYFEDKLKKNKHRICYWKRFNNGWYIFNDNSCGNYSSRDANGF